jgi:GT2 family glycosyltransferase
MSVARGRVVGKFLHVGRERLLVKGVTYDGVVSDSGDHQFPSLLSIRADFRALAQAGINTIRVDAPPHELLDEAAHHGLHVVVGIPWRQHVAFLDDRHLVRSIRRFVSESVQAVARHQATLLMALGNEIPSSIVRWFGPRRVERFLRELYDDAKRVAPEGLFTYLNSPATEFLSLPFFDVCSFKVGLQGEAELRAYLARLQHVAGHKPLLLTEAGAGVAVDADGRSAPVAVQLRAAFSEGACGAIACRLSDASRRSTIVEEDGAAASNEGPRHHHIDVLARAFADLVSHREARLSQPKVSVVVCAYNAADTIEDCLCSLEELSYGNFEVVVVNDGSHDATGVIARRHAGVHVIDVPNGGLSLARNIGLSQATGEIVAYTDADVRVDPDWLHYLVQPFLTSDVVGSGGPNVVPDDDPWVAQCIARSPGAPTHVLLNDRVAEHVPGCNMAFRRDALLAIGGFNPIYRRAGDDVDICWRLQARGYAIGFAPAALVWHRHRRSVRAYWRQQVGYGEAESWLTSDHPEKFLGGRAQWRGRVYSPLPFVRSISGHRVNSGVWGTAEFPSVYRTDVHPMALMPHLARWQLLSFGLLIASLAARTLHFGVAVVLLVTGLVGLTVTAARCLSFALLSDIDALPSSGKRGSSWIRFVYRATIAWLHATQPLARAFGRVRGALSPPHRTEVAPSPGSQSSDASTSQFRATFSLLAGGAIRRQFWNDRPIDRAFLLARISERLRTSGTARAVEIDDGWRSDHDIRVVAGKWTALDLHGLVEEHGASGCLFRVRIHLRVTAAAIAAAVAAAVVVGLLVVAQPIAALSIAAAEALMLAWSVHRISRTVGGVQSVIERVVSEVGMLSIRKPPLQPPETHDTVQASTGAPVEFRSTGTLRMARPRSSKSSGEWVSGPSAARRRDRPMSGDGR